MNEIQFSSTAEMPIEEIARAIGAVWDKVEYDRSDEPDEVETAESYARFCRVQNIDLARSSVARDGADRVVGIALLGVRGERGWCGDFGVVPEWRGRGVGQRLMADFVERARALGLRSLQLEVRQDNLPAVKIYERAGYRIGRSNLELTAAVADLRLGEWPEAAAIPVSPSDVVRWYGERFAWIPLWERELASLLAMDKTLAWVSRRGGRERAFLLYEPQGSRGYAAVLHLGAIPEASWDDLRTLLLAALAQDRAATRVIFEGVPEGERSVEWLKTLGFRQMARLYEMILEPL